VARLPLLGILCILQAGLSCYFRFICGSESGGSPNSAEHFVNKTLLGA